MTGDIDVVIYTLLMLGYLLFIARILGRRTLSELTFYDFVVGLVMGNIGASVITEPEFSARAGFIGLTVTALWVLLINTISLKSVPARKLIESEPLLVIHNGKILEQNLRKRYYNVNDILEMLRVQGIFDPGQVEVALIEADGRLSVLKKQQYQTLTAQDLNLTNQGQTPASRLVGKELIIDGTIIEQGLTQSGMTSAELRGQLRAMGVNHLADVTLAMITPEGKLYVDKRSDKETTSVSCDAE
jgi:uncharacterized membrane protein YcaP (DUF421 family)